MIWIIGAAMIALTIVYMLRPRFKSFVLSAAAFFEQTQPEKPPRLQLRLDAALFSRSYWIQIIAFSCLILAFVLSQYGVEQPSAKNIGVWFVIDTSASMSTTSASGNREDDARAEATAVLDQLQKLPDDVHVCVALTTFDLDLTVISPSMTRDALKAALPNIQYRTLGTDLTLPHRLMTMLQNQDGLQCPLTHLVVISDSTPPGWVNEPTPNTSILWQLVGQPANNVGIVDVSRSGGSVLGWQGDIRVDVAAYGTVPAQTTVTMRNESDGVEESQIAQWKANREHVTFQLSKAGTYTFKISDGGAYHFDDQAQIVVGEIEQRRVDWRLPNTDWMTLMGWQLDTVNPDIRVVDLANPLIENIPTLIVGSQYLQKPNPTEIGYFEQLNPLLDNLNLDVAESMGIGGVNIGSIPGIHYALVDEGSQSIWIATHDEPRFAYIPGLPTQTGDENMDSFSRTLFFNAVRWLLQTRQLPALYELTSPAQPTIEGNRIALHRGEGDTIQTATSVGDIASIAPLNGGTHENPIWVWLVVAAALLIFLEHVLALFGGRRWGT